MTPDILNFIRRAIYKLPMFQNTLEVGSLDVNGSVREVLQIRSVKYKGVDILGGPGVDEVVKDIDELLDRDERYDLVACCETLEHVLDPLRMVRTMRELLLPGGFLLITTPGYGFPVHRFPIDTFRFGEDCYRLVFFADMELMSLDIAKDRAGYDILCGFGRKR
jgi:SAM-dependent methyltransferase